GGTMMLCIACLLVGCTRTAAVGGGGASGPRTVVGRAQLRSATVDVVSGATVVDVSARPLDGALYRVSTPEGSGIRPLATRTGATVRVAVTGTGTEATAVAAVAVVVATGVRWSIVLDGGATSESVDMSQGSLISLTFAAGVSDASVRLPPPSGTQGLHLDGGASRLVVTAPAGAPAEVRALGGASVVELDGVSHHGVSGGSTFADPGWATAHDRYVLELAAGASDVEFQRS
ncbi:MAG: hypothetical protein ACRDY1_12310, partial [Acidimicrobiales bacterium]